jgi:hypothetical protein
MGTTVTSFGEVEFDPPGAKYAKPSPLERHGRPDKG